MANPVVIERGLNAIFAQAMVEFNRAMVENPGLMAAALEAPSDGSYEDYGWLGAMPVVKEWLGELTTKELEDFKYSIVNKEWESSVPIKQSVLDDDQVGVLRTVPSMLVSRLMAHPEKLLIDLLTGGTSNLAYDGVAFFSNVSGKRTIDNLAAGSGTTLANLEADLAAGEAAMAAFTDDQGEPLNIKPSMIVCPVALRNKLSRLVYSMDDPTATASGTFNPYSGRYTVIADARLDATDTNDWYLLATNEPIKPLIFQLREPPSPQMEKVPLQSRWIYYAKSRWNAGYGLPHLAYKVVNS